MGAATTTLFVAAGLMASTVDDRLASPLLYRAWGPSLAVGLDRPGDWWVQARLGGGTRWSTPMGHGRRHISLESEDPFTGETSTRDLVLPSRGFEFGAHASVLRRAGPLWVGPSLRVEGRYTGSGHVLGSWGDGELGLEATVFGVHRARGLALQGGASAHLLGVVTRMPFDLNPLVHDRSVLGGFFSEGTRVTTPRGHQALRVSGRLQRDPEGGRKAQPFVGLDLSVVSDRSPEPLLRTRGVVCLGYGRVPARGVR